jgi:hypothetical protein
MDNRTNLDKPQATDQLHSVIHIALAGLAVGMVTSAWIFFSQGGYLELDLGIISMLVLIIVAIPTAMYFASGTFQGSERTAGSGRSFSKWMSGEFATSQGRRKAASASIEILLPMTAAVIGIVAIGIVFRLTEIGNSWF